MIQNIKDAWNVIVLYEGTGYTLILYVLALIYLFITEKNRRIRYTVLYIPLTLLILFMCPLFYRVYVLYLDDSGTYYRVLWLIPLLITIAYAACRLIMKHRRIGLAVMTALIVLCGGYAYSADGTASVTKAENAYHIPQYIIDICDDMEQEVDGVNVYACVPTEMLFYVRQYDSNINLIYGRDAVEPKWGYYNEVYEAFEKDEYLDLEKLLDLTRNNEIGKICSYFVIRSDRKMNGDPETLGLEKVSEENGYVLYHDTVAAEIVREMFKGTAYEQ